LLSEVTSKKGQKAGFSIGSCSPEPGRDPAAKVLMFNKALNKRQKYQLFFFLPVSPLS